jgi:hypothetical protein
VSYTHWPSVQPTRPFMHFDLAPTEPCSRPASSCITIYVSFLSLDEKIHRSAATASDSSFVLAGDARVVSSMLFLFPPPYIPRCPNPKADGFQESPIVDAVRDNKTRSPEEEVDDRDDGYYIIPIPSTTPTRHEDSSGGHLGFSLTILLLKALGAFFGSSDASC